MIKNDKKYYPAKILLFGEYTVLQNSDSLAIPFYGFQANWKQGTKQEEHYKSLCSYYSHLESNFPALLDYTKWRSDLDVGVFLQSDIPSGFGVGSSGSLVASIYDTYVYEREIELPKLIEIFQKMEDYFHGNSSGIDPLISYLDKPILKENGVYSEVELENNSIVRDLYIWDSQTSRSTSTLVDWYKANLNIYSEFEKIIKELAQKNKSIIQDFLNNRLEDFESQFHSISELQREFFTPMFPPEIVEKMEKQLGSGSYQVKLCGAGGGGFYLIYCPRPTDLQAQHLIPLSPREA